MKKFFVLFTLGLALLSFTANASSRYPNIIVNKHNGGWSAILNLYNEVVYTPSDVSGDILGTLECSGLGFTPCRVPTVNSIGLQTGNLQVPNAAIESKLLEAVNDLIAKSETSAERGTLVGSASKTIAVTTSSTGTTRGVTKTYTVRCEWQYQSTGDAVLYIYLNNSNLFGRI